MSVFVSRCFSLFTRPRCFKHLILYNFIPRVWMLLRASERTSWASTIVSLFLRVFFHRSRAFAAKLNTRGKYGLFLILFALHMKPIVISKWTLTVLVCACVCVRADAHTHTQRCSLARHEYFSIRCTLKRNKFSWRAFHLYRRPVRAAFAWLCESVCVVCSVHAANWTETLLEFSQNENMWHSNWYSVEVLQFLSFTHCVLVCHFICIHRHAFDWISLEPKIRFIVWSTHLDICTNVCLREFGIQLMILDRRRLCRSSEKMREQRSKGRI